MGGYWWEGSEGTRRGLGTERVDPIDLQDPKLQKLALNLNLAYLRIGGTEADQLIYKVKKKKAKKKAKKHHRSSDAGELLEKPLDGNYVLDRIRWKELEAFCREIDAELFMTLNAGPGRRKEDDTWKRKNARSLIRYSRKRSSREGGRLQPIWELGNEVNAYRFFYGPGKGISPRCYADDVVKLKSMLEKEGGGSTAGPALVVWPVAGEVFPFLRRFLKNLSSRSATQSATQSSSLDILTWHFYPQQSFRCPVATRRAKPRTLLNPRHLDALGRQAGRINRLRDRYIPQAQVWLGETGHAQCGGEPGLSDRFVSSLWWLDTLGQMALMGQGQVIRQSLIGGDYGLINYKTKVPNPDYWATILWNSLMGDRVYRLKVKGSRKLRAYLHSHPHRPGLYSLLVINLEWKREGRLLLSEDFASPEEQWLLSSDSPFSSQILLNGKALDVSDDMGVPDLSGRECRILEVPAEGTDAGMDLPVPPLSYAFFTVPTRGDRFGVYPETLVV